VPRDHIAISKSGENTTVKNAAQQIGIPMLRPSVNISFCRSHIIDLLSLERFLEELVELAER
jgi:hypothetical protein